jgi:hypothetical protein
VLANSEEAKSTHNNRQHKPIYIYADGPPPYIGSEAVLAPDADGPPPYPVDPPDVGAYSNDPYLHPAPFEDL